MPDTKSSSRMPSILTGLRGVLMLLAGLYALFFPGMALLVLTTVAAALFVVDGVLGLWSITFGGGKTGNFWFDVIRNALSIIVGALILISPFLGTLIAATFLVYLVAIQAIFVGAMEITVILREREHYAKIWPVLLSGALYVIFGAVLIFMPLIAAEVLVMLGGILIAIFSLGLFGLAWRLYKAGH
ncbi:HdeD family acid-resistance protein [Pelagibacterium halotolerans]|uniref:HdeD family acid-resistance protein n=1 Tax=Pelagibacterium halotolerans TaxID=531813 RepID=UPI003850A4C1